jgi:ABC-type transport system involved in multi-copper enzyme maturation permease subunit
MPTLAIFRHELRALRGSWLVWVWCFASFMLTLLVMSGGWAELPTPQLIASLWFPFLVFPWFLVAMVLGIAPVTGSRAESLADGILSRPVTRYEYFLACWAARVVTVLAVFLIVTLPFVIVVAFAKRPVTEDAVTLYGVVSAVSVVGLVLTFQVSLGFLLGTLLRNTLLAAMVLIFIWIPVNMVFTTFELEEFSPISLNQALPALLRQSWYEGEEDPAVDLGTEYEKVARQEGEEGPEVNPGTEYEEAAHQLNAFFASFPSTQPPLELEPEPAPETESETESGFYNQEGFQDVSLLRLLLGYGIPTLLSIALATFCFSRRDL